MNAGEIKQMTRGCAGDRIAKCHISDAHITDITPFISDQQFLQGLFFSETYASPKCLFVLQSQWCKFFSNHWHKLQWFKPLASIAIDFLEIC